MTRLEVLRGGSREVFAPDRQKEKVAIGAVDKEGGKIWRERESEKKLSPTERSSRQTPRELEKDYYR